MSYRIRRSAYRTAGVQIFERVQISHASGRPDA
jgi:hypothetical protein